MDLITRKKIYFHNFFPTKVEEDAFTADSIPISSRFRRKLIEIRDVRPSPMLDPSDPWKIKKTISQEEITSGKIFVSFNDAFEYIFRYWNFWMANHVAILGHKVSVVLWEVTYARNPKKYHGNEFHFQITPDDEYNFNLTCMGLMKERNWKEGDYIGLNWDPMESNFYVKLFVRE